MYLQMSLFFSLSLSPSLFILSTNLSLCLSLSTSLPPSLFLSVWPFPILFPFLSLYFAHFLSLLSSLFSLSGSLPFPVLLFNPSANLSVFSQLEFNFWIDCFFSPRYNTKALSWQFFIPLTESIFVLGCFVNHKIIKKTVKNWYNFFSDFEKVKYLSWTIFLIFIFFIKNCKIS